MQMHRWKNNSIKSCGKEEGEGLERNTWTGRDESSGDVE